MISHTEYWKLIFFCGRQDALRHTNLCAHKLRQCFFSYPSLFVTSYCLIGLASLTRFVLRKDENTVRANLQLSSSREQMIYTQNMQKLFSQLQHQQLWPMHSSRSVPARLCSYHCASWLLALGVSLPRAWH